MLVETRASPIERHIVAALPPPLSQIHTERSPHDRVGFGCRIELTGSCHEAIRLHPVGRNCSAHDSFGARLGRAAATQLPGRPGGRRCRTGTSRKAGGEAETAKRARSAGAASRGTQGTPGARPTGRRAGAAGTARSRRAAATRASPRERAAAAGKAGRTRGTGPPGSAAGFGCPGPCPPRGSDGATAGPSVSTERSGA